MNNEMNNQNLNNNIENLNPNPNQVSTPPVEALNGMTNSINNSNPTMPSSGMESSNSFNNFPNNINNVPNNNFSNNINNVPNNDLNSAPQSSFNTNMNNQVNLQPEGIVVPQNNMPNNVAEPLQATSLNNDTVINPNNYQNTQNFGQQPNYNQPVNNPNNDIGLMGGVPVPPVIPEEPKKNNNKKNINPTLLVILIIVLIAAIGFGIYYFLTASKSKTSAVTITPFLTNVELGAEIVDNPASYAKVTGVSISTCTVNSNLDTKTVGTYEYTITCGTKTSPVQKVVVEDTTAPIVETKDVVVLPNTTVTADDFIAKVTDASYDEEDDTTMPTIKFASDETIDTSTESEQTVSIIVSDLYENEVTVEANLIVTNNAPQEYMYCETDVTTEEKATATATYRFGIDLNGELYNSQKTVVYKFENEEDYLAAVAQIDETGVFDGYEANISMDSDFYTIVVEIDLTNDDLLKDFALDSFPTSEGDIEGLFTNPCEYNEE